VRTGESGPFLDWLYWLRNLTYFAGFKRIWTAQQTGSPITIPDGGSGTPGTEVLDQEIEWTAEDYAIAGQLHYIVLARCVFNTAPAPAALPGVLLMNLNTEAAGAGFLTTAHTWNSFTSPSGTGQFDTRGQTFGAWMLKFGDFPVFAVGQNRFSLGIGNPAAGADIYAQNAELLIAELATPPGTLFTP
jgi:hypothetical protein